jgi:hypothetical protein
VRRAPQNLVPRDYFASLAMTLTSWAAADERLGFAGIVSLGHAAPHAELGP